jgi:hypothetical protein
VEGKAPTVKYALNRHNYNMGYYLADEIYPNWSTFVKIIKAPTSLKAKHFATAQEAQRKDVERHLMSCRLDFILFSNQLDYGMKPRFETL